MDYETFLKNKVVIAEDSGFAIRLEEINPILKDHQKQIVQWMIRGGRRACFASFGLGKSVIQLEAVRITRARAGGKGLIVIPLGVRQEFTRDAAMLGIQVKFIRRIEEADQGDECIYMTNYETVRDGKLNPQLFTVASLDEASILRGFGGTKTFREFMATFAGDRKTMDDRIMSEAVPYRYVATATPSPNEYIELLAYAAFLGVMDVGAAKTRFFKRDSTKADHLTIHPHKEAEFWLWVASWGLFVQRPSDIGCSDDGYIMPGLDVRWHEVDADHALAGHEVYGQARMFKAEAIGVVESSREKRESLPSRIEKMMELRAEDPGANRLLWHDLESERYAIEKAIPGVVSVYGSQELEDREKSIIGFSNGEFQELAAKPVIAGSGCNFQRHCNWAIFLGIGFKFNDFIQAVHRIQRFLQTKTVRIDLIYTSAEREVRRQLERKWEQHNILVEKMTSIIKEFGLSQAAMASTLTRAMGVERAVVEGKMFQAIHNDCILETARMDENSVGLVLTSIPFSTQYEYSPNYADFGHTDNNEHFFQQMDYLTPNLLKILKPGRILAVHVKDRIVPGGMTGLGFQTVYPLHARCIEHYTKAGFGYMGMKTIVTDVVRENNQTYRLGWTEQCKDGTKMGVGMPEYLLLFRKPPTSTEKSYSDEPVVKNKPDCIEDGQVIPWKKNADEVIGTGYSRGRWQIDAHGFARSSGDRFLTPDELASIPHEAMFKAYRKFSLENVYDFEHHVHLNESLGIKGMLPTSFMLLQPQSWHPDVWTDITRMLTLNTSQSQKNQAMHLCPMQFDLADRVIEQFSMKGEVVFDPFGGLMTVPYRAILKGRYGMATELSAPYFADGVGYLAAAEREMSMPSLFDFEELAA
jgi:hypothetical protein